MKKNQERYGGEVVLEYVDSNLGGVCLDGYVLPCLWNDKTDKLFKQLLTDEERQALWTSGMVELSYCGDTLQLHDNGDYDNLIAWWKVKEVILPERERDYIWWNS